MSERFTLDEFNTVPAGPPPDAGLAETLDATAAFIRRFVVVNQRQLDVLALWVFHTWAVNAADTTAYLGIVSALLRSGKTRLLEVLELLVREPLPTANISDAALFRAISKMQPTLLFDEIDSIFGPKARDREDLRGMLNAGYRRGAVCYRMGGANNRTLESFDVYCVKAFAGIGELPQTIRDRAIRIRLERRVRQERIERFRRRDTEPAAGPIRQAIVNLADQHLRRLMEARPELPDALDDRAQDVWEPLLAIADLAGGDWPERARAAAIALSSDSEREDDSHGVLLLRDLHTVFHAKGPDRYKTADLVAELSKIEESPWGDWYGKPITPQALGKLLKPFRIRTMPVRVDGEKARGYKAEQFTEAWARVLGGTGGTGGTSRSSTDAGCTARTARTAQHASNGDRPDFPEPSEWLARDGQWRPFDTDPPVFPGEVVGTRNAGEQPADKRSTR